MSDAEIDEYRREEYEYERKNDELYALLKEGYCPICKEYTILLRDEPDEKLYYCSHCGEKWEA